MDRISKWLTVCVLVLLPVQTHWLLLGASWEFGTARLLVMECIVVVLALLYTPDWWRARSRHARRTTVVAIAGLLIWGSGSLVSAMQAVHVASAMMLGIVLWETLRRFGAQWVLSWFIVGGAVWASLGLVQWLQQQVVASVYFGMASHAPAVAGDAVVRIDGVRMLRVYGPMPHPNVFGGLMVMYVYAALLLMRTTTQYRRAVVIGALSLCSAALVLSFSRSAWIAAVLVAIIAIPRQRAWIRLLAVPAVVTLVVALLVAPGIGSRLHADNTLEVRSRDERTELWHDGVQLVREHLFWGTGLGLATTVTHELNPQRETWTLQPAHFTPLLVFAELGIIGVLALGFCLSAMPWDRGLAVLVPVLFFDHYLWSLPAGLFLLTSLWFLTTIQTKLALDTHEC